MLAGVAGLISLIPAYFLLALEPLHIGLHDRSYIDFSLVVPVLL